ncbi:MAG: hypothetical protein QM820_03245 [Minicystis sp.]
MVGVAPSRAGLELSIVDRITGKTVLREVDGDGGHDETVALRAVELLRASLMEIDAPHPSRGEAAAPPEIRTIVSLPPPAPAPAPAPAFPASPAASFAPPLPPAAPPSPIVTIGFGPAILGSPGGLSPLSALEVDARFRIGTRVAAGITAIVPLGTATNEGLEGSARTRVALFTAEARVDLHRGARLVPTLGGGALFAWLHTDGTGRPPLYVGVSSDGFTGGPFLRPGLGVTLVPKIRLRADLLAGVAVRRLHIDFAGRDVARWGVPILAGSFGMEVDVP